MAPLKCFLLDPVSFLPQTVTQLIMTHRERERASLLPSFYYTQPSAAASKAETDKQQRTWAYMGHRHWYTHKLSIARGVYTRAASRRDASHSAFPGLLVPEGMTSREKGGSSPLFHPHMLSSRPWVLSRRELHQTQTETDHLCNVRSNSKLQSKRLFIACLVEHVRTLQSTSISV